MKAFGFYKSKKYFHRVLFSITLAMALVLTGLSVANTWILERSVRSAQEDSNLKVLAQIQYNLSYMNEIVTHLSAVAFRDNYLIPLLFSDPLPAMDYIRGYNEMAKLMESSSFLHSIAVYNGTTDALYGSSSAFLVDGGETERRIRNWLLHSPGPLPTSRLIPVRLGADDGPIDAFAYLVTDSYKPFAGGESALILYIRSDWVFDGLRRMNGAGSGVPGEIYIRTSDGKLFGGGDSSGPEAPDEAAIAALIDRDRARTQARREDGAGDAPDSGFVVGDAGASKSVVTYMNGAGDWTILYVQPYGPMMKDVTAARERSLLVTGGFLLLAVGVSVWLSYKLYDPIETMLRRIRPHLTDAGNGEEPFDGNELDAVGDNVQRLSERLQEISSEQIVRKYYLRKFLTDSGLFFEEDMRQLIGKHGLNLSPDDPLTVCVLRIDRFGAYDRSTSAATKKLHGFAVVNIARELMSSAFRCEAVDLQSDHAVLVVSGADGAEAGRETKRLLRDVQDAVQRYYGLSLSCGISDPVARLPLLSNAYRQAEQLSRYMFSAGYRSIVTPNDIRDRTANAPAALPPDIERRLTEALRKGRLTNAGSELERAFALLASFTHEGMRRAVSDLAWAIRNAAADIRTNRLVSLSVDTERLLRTAEDNETLEDMYLTFLSVCAQICEGQKPTASVERSEWIVGTVKELIARKYPDPNLSQQSVASTVKLTSAYVGKLFKDQCGMTITEYINEVRLGHARQLLLKTDDTIAEIMDQCGYSNQSYFFRLFKGKFGSTPKEYRLKGSISS